MGWGMNSGGGGTGRNGGAASSDAQAAGIAAGLGWGGYGSKAALDAAMAAARTPSGGSWGTGGVSGRGMTAQQERGLLSTGMGGMFFSNPKEVSRHYQQVDYANRQRRIKEAAAARRAAEARDLAGINSLAKRGAISAANYGKALKAHNTGDLNAIEGVTGKRSAMRDTHHSGGIFGDMFGLTGDDVQTMTENDEGLAKSGQLERNADGTYSPAGWGPMNPVGFLSSMTSTPIAGKVAEATYGYTGSVPGAMTAGQLTKTGIDAYGTKAQPSAFNGATSMALGFAGVPGVTQLGQMGKTMQNAANLAYGGYTASPTAPTPASRNDAARWWPYVGGLLA